MPAVLGVAIGLSLAALSGGRLARIQSLQLVGQVPLLVLYVIQAVARGRFLGIRGLGSPALWVWVAVSLTVIAILAANWRQPGAAVIAVGMATNLLVILANGAMPVLLTQPSLNHGTQMVAESAVMYVAVNQATLAPLLGDVLEMRLGAAALLLSVGDVMLVVGVCTLLVSCAVRTTSGDPRS